VEQSLGLATALCPYVGYDAASKIAQHAAREGLSVREAARAILGWDEARLTDVLNPESMLAPVKPKREFVCFTADRPGDSAPHDCKD